MTLNTDAKDVQVLLVLLQEQSDRRTKPVGYWFRLLTNTKCVYNTPKRDCFAILRAKLILKHYDEGTTFTVRTEQKLLRRILNLSDAFEKLAQWRLRLHELNFDVIQGAVHRQQVAGAILRSRTYGGGKTHSDDDLSVCNFENVQVTDDERL